MSTQSLSQFQEQVSELLLRHRSLLDVLSKNQQATAAVHRSVIKAITECGCIQVHAAKQEYTPDMTLDDAKEQLDTHMDGKLCESCCDVVAAEMGKNLFYMASLGNLLNINLEQVLEEESNRCSTLGLFKLT